eukprot:g4272.t1
METDAELRNRRRSETIQAYKNAVERIRSNPGSPQLQARDDMQQRNRGQDKFSHLEIPQNNRYSEESQQTLITRPSVRDIFTNFLGKSNNQQAYEIERANSTPRSSRAVLGDIVGILDNQILSRNRKRSKERAEKRGSIMTSMGKMVSRSRKEIIREGKNLRRTLSTISRSRSNASESDEFSQGGDSPRDVRRSVSSPHDTRQGSANRNGPPRLTDTYIKRNTSPSSRGSRFVRTRNEDQKRNPERRFSTTSIGTVLENEIDEIVEEKEIDISTEEDLVTKLQKNTSGSKRRPSSSGSAKNVAVSNQIVSSDSKTPVGGTGAGTSTSGDSSKMALFSPGLQSEFSNNLTPRETLSKINSFNTSSISDLDSPSSAQKRIMTRRHTTASDYRKSTRSSSSLNRLNQSRDNISEEFSIPKTNPELIAKVREQARAIQKLESKLTSSEQEIDRLTKLFADEKKSLESHLQETMQKVTHRFENMEEDFHRRTKALTEESVEKLTRQCYQRIEKIGLHAQLQNAMVISPLNGKHRLVRRQSSATSEQWSFIYNTLSQWFAQGVDLFLTIIWIFKSIFYYPFKSGSSEDVHEVFQKGLFHEDDISEGDSPQGNNTYRGYATTDEDDSYHHRERVGSGLSTNSEDSPMTLRNRHREQSKDKDIYQNPPYSSSQYRYSRHTNDFVDDHNNDFLVDHDDDLHPFDNGRLDHSPRGPGGDMERDRFSANSEGYYGGLDNRDTFHERERPNAERSNVAAMSNIVAGL